MLHNQLVFFILGFCYFSLKHFYQLYSNLYWINKDQFKYWKGDKYMLVAKET